MTAYLLDTDVVAALRHGPDAAPALHRWLDSVADDAIYLSALTMGELQRVVVKLRHDDPKGAMALDAWLGILIRGHGDRILPVTAAVSRCWGELPLGPGTRGCDGLLVATAHAYGLVLATGRTRDLTSLGIQCVDPFQHSTG